MPEPSSRLVDIGAVGNSPNRFRRGPGSQRRLRPVAVATCRWLAEARRRARNKACSMWSSSAPSSLSALATLLAQRGAGVVAVVVDYLLVSGHEHMFEKLEYASPAI
jgi:hypothetical protein